MPHAKASSCKKKNYEPKHGCFYGGTEGGTAPSKTWPRGFSAPEIFVMLKSCLSGSNAQVDMAHTWVSIAEGRKASHVILLDYRKALKLHVILIYTNKLM